MTDEQVVSVAQGHQGSSTDAAVEYLLYKYKNFVRSKARSYFLIGADHEDIVQEGMIGLYKAIRDYPPEDSLSTFRAFAELCVTRQIITAIKTATRQKHVPLNSYVSLNRPIYDEDSDRTLHGRDHRGSPRSESRRDAHRPGRRIWSPSRGRVGAGAFAAWSRTCCNAYHGRQKLCGNR